MDVRNVVGISDLKYAVVLKDYNRVISLHEHPDNARRSMEMSAISDSLEVVKLQDVIGYQRH